MALFEIKFLGDRTSFINGKPFGPAIMRYGTRSFTRGSARLSTAVHCLHQQINSHRLFYILKSNMLHIVGVLNSMFSVVQNKYRSIYKSSDFKFEILYGNESIV